MLEIGKTYIGHITRRFGDNDIRDDFQTIMFPCFAGPNPIKIHFIENKIFLVIEFCGSIGNYKQYKILLDNKLYFLNYHQEPQTEFELMC